MIFFKAVIKMNTKHKTKILRGLLLCTFALFICASLSLTEIASFESTLAEGYIKWVDYSVTETAMSDALNIDIQTYGDDVHISWIDILAYLGAKYGGDFSHYKRDDMTRLANRLKDGEDMQAITLKMKFFDYYKEAYSVILGEYVGEMRLDGKELYGLRAFFPIAKGYHFNHYDDFGAKRSYGYKRSHLGHDLMGSTGTPIIAVESGFVESLGWNQYGGWRVGIRSFDNQRYYYYAHLRKDHPYTDIKEGDIVMAGDVIGYLGMTGYSIKENVNNINVPHLHFGIQLIFDPSQKDGNDQIWIDPYEIVKFLQKNKMAVIKGDDGEYHPASEVVIFNIPD